MGGPSLLTPGYIPEHDSVFVHLHPEGYLTLLNHAGLEVLRHPDPHELVQAWFTAAQAWAFRAIAIKAMRLLNGFLRGDPDFEHLHFFFVCVLRMTEPNPSEVQRMVTATRFVPLRAPAPLIELDLRRKEA